jgi:hypothetical protein
MITVTICFRKARCKMAWPCILPVGSHVIVGDALPLKITQYTLDGETLYAYVSSPAGTVDNETIEQQLIDHLGFSN